MSDSVPPPPPNNNVAIEWLFPFFDRIVDTVRRHVVDLQVARSSKAPGQSASVYVLQDGFIEQDRPWIKFVRDDRMHRSSDVLYRPAIVNHLVQRIDTLLASDSKRGLLVKGPEGVGKSYSLINLTRYLLASGNYWVTIIPNCQHWTNTSDFLYFLLDSFGIDTGPFCREYATVNDDNLDGLIENLIIDLDQVLSETGKMKWVFVFDQVNKIFARKDFQTTNDISVLSFPFHWMYRVMKPGLIKPGRIISIIAASGNNHVSHRGNHPGFDVFEHPTRLDYDEIQTLYTQSVIVAQWDWNQLEYMTGGVPLYLCQWAQDPDEYHDHVLVDIKGSLEKLKNETWSDNWENYVTSAVHCILQLPFSHEPRHLDYKFSLLQEEEANGRYQWNIVALFPLVEQAYRLFLGNYIYTHIWKKEGDILAVCRNGQTPCDVRDRLLEDMVVARLVSAPNDIKMILADAGIPMNDTLEKALGQPAVWRSLDNNHQYPASDDYGLQHVTYFIPTLPNFPAVDLMIRVQRIVIAIQIHTADQPDVSTTLVKNIEKAGWTPLHVETIILVYLSPTDTTRQELKRKISSRPTVATTTRQDRKRKIQCGTQPWQSDWVVITLFYSIDQFGNMPWVEPRPLSRA